MSRALLSAIALLWVLVVPRLAQPDEIPARPDLPQLPGFRVELVHYRDLDGSGQISCADHLRFRATLGDQPSARPISDAMLEIRVPRAHGRLRPGSTFATLPGPDEGPVVVEHPTSELQGFQGESQVVRLGRVCSPGACPFQNPSPGTQVDFEVIFRGTEMLGSPSHDPPLVWVQARSRSHATKSFRVSVAVRPCTDEGPAAPPTTARGRRD